MGLYELIDSVEEWADDRGIVAFSTPQAQLLKAVSELGELCDAEIKDDFWGVMDSVGDTLVCLIIYCKMKNIGIDACLAQAYEEIKNRKGKVVEGGAFVREQ